MKNLLETLLPAKADNTIRGSKLPFYVFILLATIGVVRSCIHIFSPDGGAGSIAGMTYRQAQMSSSLLLHSGVRSN